MDNSRLKNRRSCRIAAAVIMLLLAGFTVLIVIQFIQTVSTMTLLITGGIILSWRIWKFMFKLLLLLLQVGVFFYVIYLLIA